MKHVSRLPRAFFASLMLLAMTGSLTSCNARPTIESIQSPEQVEWMLAESAANAHAALLHALGKTEDEAEQNLPAERILEAINAYRTTYGLSELTLTDALSDIASLRVTELCYQPQNAQSSSFTLHCDDEVETVRGETIMQGSTDPTFILEAIQQSPNQMAQLLCRNYVAVGYACNARGDLCVLVFSS